MTTTGVRLLASVVILLGAMLLNPPPAVANCGFCGDNCLCCQCSGQGNYVCCMWVGGVFRGCANYGQVTGLCGVEDPEQPGG